MPDSRKITLKNITGPAWRSAGAERDVAVLMSGGVDSSVVAMMLKDQGWNVLGVTMQMPDPTLPGNGAAESKPKACESKTSPPSNAAEMAGAVEKTAAADAARLSAAATGEESGEAARLVAEQIGIPHCIADVRAAFQEEVIGRTRQDYFNGRTPNPCVFCNALLKFGGVLEAVEERWGIRWAASGHYARILREAGRAFLARGSDSRRDQSYFLYWIPARRLEWMMFPLWDHAKSQTRDLARGRGLAVAEKPDSMDFCFFAHAGLSGDYRDAIQPSAEQSRPGLICDPDGKTLGEHTGIHQYTVGQRKGLPAQGKPIYVAGIDAAKGTIIVAARERLDTRIVRARTANVLIPKLFREGERLLGKIRSTGEPTPCRIAAAGECGSAMSVEFDAPQFGPAPGQHLVLWDERGRVVGGGVIEPSLTVG